MVLNDCWSLFVNIDVGAIFKPLSMALTQGRRRRRRETRRRRRKVYFPRVNPMKRYDDTKFMARYRLSKEIVSELAAEFKASGLCSTSTPRGGGLSVEERVSYRCLGQS